MRTRTHAWDPNTAADAAFFALSANGSISSVPDTDPVIDEDELLSEGGRLVYAGVRLAATGSGKGQRRAILSAESESTWAPDGLEVKISGASGSRKV